MSFIHDFIFKDLTWKEYIKLFYFSVIQNQSRPSENVTMIDVESTNEASNNKTTVVIIVIITAVLIVATCIIIILIRGEYVFKLCYIDNKN